MNIDECIQKLRTLDDFTFGQPAKDDELENIENTLKNKLPFELKILIRNLGFASWLGGEIYGISENSFYNIIDQTIDARTYQTPTDFASFPNNTFVLSQYGGGGYYLIFGEEVERPGEVILILSETYYEEEETWPSLSHFLEYMYLDD